MNSSCGVHKQPTYEYAGANKHLAKEVNRWLGTPYKYGGNSVKGVDCSGLVQQVYMTVYGKGLYRTTIDILNKNCKRIKVSRIREGDLLFFCTSKGSRKANHVGIYLYDDKFIHASSSKGVVISSLNNSYYVRNFITAGRVH